MNDYNYCRAGSSLNTLVGDGEFQLDGALPRDFPFAALTLNQSALNIHYRRANIYAIDVSTQLQVNLVNFKYLVDESIIEPTVVDLKLDVHRSRAAALFSSHKPIYFNISQGEPLKTRSFLLKSFNSI